MENYCTVDFETRSATPLSMGLQAYFADKHFEVLCGAFQFKGKKPVSFYGKNTKIMCLNLVNFMKNYPLLSFNSAFEAGCFAKLTGMDYFEAFKRIFPVELAVKYLGGPDNLKMSAPFLGLKEAKDFHGEYLKKVLCVPINPKTPDLKKWQDYTNENDFVEHPTLSKALLKYCKQDVVVTTEIFKKVEKYIPEMKNLKAFDDNQLNFLRNNQGIRFNLKRVKQLSNIVEKLKVKYKERAKMLVGDSNFNLNSDVQIKKVLKDFKLENTQAQSLKPLYPKLKPNIQKLILLRLNRPSGVSSVLNKTLSNSDKDGVVRNSIRFWGAGQTSRFTSYGVNPLTWPRLSGDSQKDIDFIKDKNKFYGKELHRSFSAVKNVMRRSIIPHKNCVFYGGDFSQIEFRLLMLCCGDLKRLKMLYNGWDCYKFLASKVYDIAIEKVTTQQRYIAKRVTLAKGYGMGVLKAQNILWAEGVFVSEDVVRSVFKAYDSSFPQVINSL